MDEKIRSILAQVLKTSADDVGAHTAIGGVRGWDSTAHMRIVLAVEDEFGIELTENQIIEMTSFEKIHEIVRKLQSSRA